MQIRKNLKKHGQVIIFKMNKKHKVYIWFGNKYKLIEGIPIFENKSILKIPEGAEFIEVYIIDKLPRKKHA